LQREVGLAGWRALIGGNLMDERLGALIG